MKRTLLFVVNVDWFFLSHRLPIALEAQRQGYQIHVASAITDKLDELKQYGFIVHPLAIDRSSLGLGELFRDLAQLWRVFTNVRPDVVHLITIKPILLGGLVARLAGVPAVVVAVSGLGFVFTARSMKAVLLRLPVLALYRVALNHRNLKIIFQNPDDRDKLVNTLNLSQSKLIMIYGSGVDLVQFSYSKLPVGTPVVLLAARLLTDKGIREFVKAARLLRLRGVLARFCLAGTVDSANPTSLTEVELEEWVNEGVIECWGHRLDMPNVFRSAYIVVLPSYREGLPKVLLEAAACGRPVVTTDVPGCRDAVSPGVTGVLVPVRNFLALADALEALVNDPEGCQSMGKAGRLLAEHSFDVRQVVSAHLNIYRELIEKL